MAIEDGLKKEIKIPEKAIRLEQKLLKN